MEDKRSLSNANPHDAHHNVHPLALPALVLETPHPVALVVPVRAARAVHAAAAHALLLPFTLTLALNFCLAARAPRIAQVLDDGAVDGELVAAAVDGGVRGLVRGGGFRDEGLQDGVDDGVVPGGGAVVLVGGCGREGGGAGVCGDLGEASGVEGLFCLWVVSGLLLVLSVWRVSE